jgi:hypothetical protein
MALSGSVASGKVVSGKDVIRISLSFSLKNQFQNSDYHWIIKSNLKQMLDLKPKFDKCTTVYETQA